MELVLSWLRRGDAWTSWWTTQWWVAGLWLVVVGSVESLRSWASARLVSYIRREDVRRPIEKEDLCQPNILSLLLRDAEAQPAIRS